MRISYKLGVIALALTLPLAACDSEEEVDVTVTPFAATLTGLNSTTPVSGTATVEIVGDQVRFTVNATGLDSVTHVQFITTGHACPDVTADANADDFIDIQEGAIAFGQPLLALDNTIDVRETTLGTFPSTGTIAYTEQARLSTVEQSLRGSDGNDITADLPVNGDFNPDGLTVLIMGTTQILPRSVGSIGDLTSNQSLPVACGVLHRVTTN